MYWRLSWKDDWASNIYICKTPPQVVGIYLYTDQEAGGFETGILGTANTERLVLEIKTLMPCRVIIDLLDSLVATVLQLCSFQSIRPPSGLLYVSAVGPRLSRFR